MIGVSHWIPTNTVSPINSVVHLSQLLGVLCVVGMPTFGSGRWHGGFAYYAKRPGLVCGNSSAMRLTLGQVYVGTALGHQCVR